MAALERLLDKVLLSARPADRVRPETDIRVAPESGRKTAAREETLDGEQSALRIATDSERRVPRAQRVVPLA